MSDFHEETIQFDQERDDMKDLEIENNNDTLSFHSYTTEVIVSMDSTYSMEHLGISLDNSNLEKIGQWIANRLNKTITPGAK